VGEARVKLIPGARHDYQLFPLRGLNLTDWSEGAPGFIEGKAMIC